MDLLLGLAGAAGLAALLQSKALPSQEDAEKALIKIEKNPLDPDANLVLGKYRAFVMGDYAGAMPYLANSKDTTLKLLAQHEIDPSHTDTPEKQVAIGDEWVLAAKKFPSLSTIFYDRASSWYIKAWPLLTDPWKIKVREQGKKLAASRPQGPKKATTGNWILGNGAEIDGTVAHTGSYSALLPPKDPKKVTSSYPNIYVESAPIPVLGKKTLSLTAKVLSDQTENPTDAIFVNIFDSNSALRATWSTVIPVDVPFWRTLSIKGDIPEQISFIKVGTIKASKAGSIWSDDFVLKLDEKEALKNGSFEER